MKKKWLKAMGAAFVLTLALAGCGNDAEPQESTAAAEESAAETETEEEKVYPQEAYLDNLNVADYVELGDYIGVEVAVAPAEVTDDQVEVYIASALDANKEKNEITDRAAENGDLVDITFVGTKDGEAFEGGTGENYEMTLGSGGYIEGFEEGIVGMKTGETKELNLTFPIPYNNNPSLAGADVVFTITMNHIYEEVTPEFDDDFVAGLELEGVTTAEEYRQYAYDNLMSVAEAQRETEVETAVLQAVSANATFKAVPEAMVERYYDRLVSNLTYQASMYGMDLETFLLYGTGLSQEEYEAEMQASAEEAVKQILVLEAIAEKEGMTVTQEDIEADLEENAASYGYESAEEYKEALGSELQGYGEYLMTQEEYPEMLQDFTGFMLRKYIPRAYKNLPGTAGLQITPTVVLSTGMLAPFYSPQAQETFRILGEIGAEDVVRERKAVPLRQGQMKLDL